MKPWTEARNNDRYMKSHSKHTYNVVILFAARLIKLQPMVHSQWEMVLLFIDVSHWLGASLAFQSKIAVLSAFP